MNKLLLFGAGGHGRVVADIAKLSDEWSSIEFLDDQFPKLSRISEWNILGKFNEYQQFQKGNMKVCITIGDNNIRMKIFRMIEKDLQIVTLIHPSAVISKSASIGVGTVIMANSVVNIDARIGKGCIINTSSIIEHDCILSDGVHISPGVNLAGNVFIGDNSWVGVGSTVKEGVTIESNAVIGAGAVVVKDVPEGMKVAGNPAKPIGH